MPIPIPITLDNEKPEKEYAFNHGKLLDLTPEAITKVQEFITKNKDKIGEKRFRVYVEGGGCSGHQYGFTFDNPKDDDNIITCGSIDVLVSEETLPFLKGSIVDYVEDSSGSGYIVKNPLSTGECSCGVSFSV